MHSWEPALADWLHAHTGHTGTRVVRALSGGNANVTLLLHTDEGALVLRTPPADAVSATSHRGIERESRVLQAVGTRARVPQFIAWCDDAAVLGAPFLVVSHVDGTSITDTLPAAYPPGVATVNALGEELVRELAVVHRLPWQEIGLEKFGRPDAFLARQIERWLAARRETSVRELPLLFELGGWLADNIPDTVHATLVHGDYHLDNTLFRPDRPELAAVIDWELATIGDPLADLGLLLMFWGARRCSNPPGFPAIQAVTRLDGAHTRRELAEAWARDTGWSLQNLDFYLCFAFWRLAAIVEGAFVLQQTGKVDTAYARGLEQDVPALLAEAAAAAQGDW